MNIVELFARIGLKTDEDKAKSFHRAMTTVKLGLIATTVVAAGTAVAIRKITSDAMNAAVAFKQFETETGASAQELQKWQAVAEQTNQSAESVSSAIKAIVSNQEKIKLGQGGDISGYQILGIDPRQDPFKILEDLRTKTKGLSDGMKKNILSQIGVGAGMLQTLNLTREEFDEMAGRAWIISPLAIETLNQTKSAVDLTARAINYMKTQIAVELSPQIKKSAKDFQAFMKVNEKAIIGGFKLGAKYVLEFTKAIYNAGSMLNRVVSSTIGWDMAIKGLLGVFLALNAAFLLSPMGLFITGIILLVAILDDLHVYSKGGKSLFGNMMKEFPALEKTVFGSFKTIKDVLELMKAFGSGDITTIDKITKKWGELGKVVKGLYTMFQNLLRIRSEITDVFFNALIEKFPQLEGPLKILKDLVKFLEKPFKIFEPGKTLQDAWKLFSDTLKTILETYTQLKSVLPDISFPDLPDFLKKAKGFDLLGSINQKLTDFSPLKLAGSGDTNVNVTQTNNITGNGDPSTVVDAITKNFQDAVNAASAQLSRNQ